MTAPLPVGETHGIVVAVRPRRVVVRIGDRELACDLRRGLLQGAREERNLLAVGDRVELEVDLRQQGVLRAVLPRRTRISRVGSRRPLREHVIAANVDQLLAMQAIDMPRLNTRSLDRYLLLGEVGGVRCGVAVNKIDLAGAARAVAPLAVYEAIGYPMFQTCALGGEGLDALREYLEGKVTLLLGPSGVGKSTLLNRLIPGIDLRVGPVSAATRRGVHTSTRIDYLDLPVGGAVLDSPGLRSIQPWTTPERLVEYFPEMRPLGAACRFRDCLHRHEPGCAICAAVAQGRLSAARHASYLRVLDGLLAEGGSDPRASRRTQGE